MKTLTAILWHPTVAVRARTGETGKRFLTALLRALSVMIA